MADTTGKDTPTTDPKAAGKTGPVKPPVLEGTARPSNAGKTGDSASAGKAAPGTADKPAAAPVAKPRTDGTADGGGGNPWLAGLVGGVLGLGAAYGLAWFGLWPQPPQPQPAADPRLAQFATAIPELETVTNTVQDELSTLTSRVASLEETTSETVAAPAVGDPALAEQVAGLSARLDELAAASASPADSEAMTNMEAELERLSADVESAQAALSQTQQQLASLSQTADENAGADAATIRLPLIFSGLESAFAAGRPFETELAALRQALPETIVPEAIAGRAATGLPRPDAVERQLVDALPVMLAGRPAEDDASWQDATAQWFRGLIAMRPAGAVEGEGPDATIARLEAAVAARDFAAARTELQALPEGMRNAAGSVAADIETLAAAEAFLSQMRTQLLVGENGA